MYDLVCLTLCKIIILGDKIIPQQIPILTPPAPLYLGTAVLGGGDRCSSAPRGSSTQWATAGALGAPCGNKWWARQGREPPTKPGWAEPRMTVRSQCSVNHPGHYAGAHATEAHTACNQQGTRPAHARPTEWGSVCGGQPGQRVEEQGTWALRTWKRSEAGCGRPEAEA